MSAQSAPESELAAKKLDYRSTDTIHHTSTIPHDPQETSASHQDGADDDDDDDDDDDLSTPGADGATVTWEQDGHTTTTNIIPAHETETTLRPAPPASAKRRESELGDSATPELSDHKSKKRKRGPSPPWTFPSAENGTVKRADGRRISARVNAGTPTLSESNEHDAARARSSSQPTSARSRPPSPPWKKFQATGPTAVQIDGVRKSGRVNKDLTASKPTRTSPRQKKHADGQSAGGVKSDAGPMPRSRVVSGVDGAADATPKKSARERRPSSPASKIRELQAQIAALKPSRSFPSESTKTSPNRASHRAQRSNDVGPQTTRVSSHPKTPKPHRESNAGLSPLVTRPSSRIKLRFNPARHLVPPPHPQAILSPPARPPRPSLYQVIEKYELKEMQQPYTETERGPPGPDFFTSRNEQQASHEASVRKRILQESQAHGILSKEQSSFYHEERQAEPPPQYGHDDHLAAHALYFRALQSREKAQHRLLAKKVAQEALEYWKAMRGPTEEDIKAEEDKIFRLIYKQVALDVKAKWEMVGGYVQQRRREDWERQEEIKRQERLQKQLEWSEQMVARQRGEGEESDIDMDGEEGHDVSGSEADGDASSEEENMTASSVDVDSEDENASESEMDEDELAAYLAQREAEPPDKDELQIALQDEVARDGTGESEALRVAPFAATKDLVMDEGSDEAQDDGFQPARTEGQEMRIDASTPQPSIRAHRSQSASPSKEVQQADDNLSSDESVDMDSEDYDSDEDMSTSDDDNPDADTADEGGGEEEEEPGEEDGTASEGDVPAAKSSLLGFFSKHEQRQFGLPTPTTSAEGDEQDRTVEGNSDENATGATQGDQGIGDETVHEDKPPMDPVVDADQQAGNDTMHDQRSNHAADISEAVDPLPAPHSPATESTTDTDIKRLVPQPSLLRGTLRSYQHAGLDWLASLYRNGTNGILADEMGLGKTIQTIALLAHLAEEYQIWETHLVIVPTSVVVNWVMEFQKFLPGFRVLGYYGDAPERQAKRKGWVNDPHHENKEKRGYNVVITSYNYAMQDINAIRNVQWHYLVLDEAHNIRNFNTQKWQVLIRLKTKARLMLTGTPLHNSLTELWSLLTFLTAGDDDPAHGDLEEFLSHWRQPVEEIFNRGVDKLSHESQKVVDQLHVSLRPFLLRRLKSEVEKDLPKKTESVVVCKLSKRQRELYHGYTELGTTKSALAGGGLSRDRVLYNLRKVCTHPELFDPRPIDTSFAMEQSAVGLFEVKDQLIRNLLGVRKAMPEAMLIVGMEDKRRYAVKRSHRLAATSFLQSQVIELEKSISEAPDISTARGGLVLQRLRRRERRLQQLRDSIQFTETALKDEPVYGSDLRELLTVQHRRPYLFTQRGRTAKKFLRGWPTLGHKPLMLDHPSDWLCCQTTALQGTVMSLDRYADTLEGIIVRFAFCPPKVTAPVLDLAISPPAQQLLRASDAYPTTSDYAHEARVRTAINFPDKRLLVFDAGKLQRLQSLLRDLQARGSRSLIFTQWTQALDILERFLSLMNLPYLRLDGSTNVERRQLYAAEFNRPDSKYQCMILSSRAGGIGLNLIGASSVIFYDLDWNPQMDRQCMDRAHRIGQVRDVEVYKLVSENTIEVNILRRANQKSLLDQTVIQEGNFTTDYHRPTHEVEDDGDDGGGEQNVEVTAALERFLGGGEKAITQALESVEDKEDVQAAQQARKEEHQDDEDFAERSSKGASTAATPGLGVAEGDVEDERNGHVDYYMIRHMERLLKDVVFVPPQLGRKLDKHGRDPSHRPKRKR